MIQLTDSVRTLIVKLYAERGVFCKTAQLIFHGGGIKPAGVTLPSVPGAYPAELVAEAEAARTQYLAARASP